MLKTIVHIDEKLQILYDHLKSLDESVELLSKKVDKLEKRFKEDKSKS
ncbi:MAG: hypothetical protein JW791_03635 [Nanoarchaeota archaeon]|nr:hypothetical protein [Nanoarchaeota archaeon]